MFKDDLGTNFGDMRDLSIMSVLVNVHVTGMEQVSRTVDINHNTPKDMCRHNYILRVIFVVSSREFNCK